MIAKRKKRRGTESLMRSITELEGYVAKGMTMDDIEAHYRRHHPDRVRTVDSVAVNQAGRYTAGAIKQMRLMLGISQAVFAQGLGVSTILVSGWEQGVREPSTLARRLLDVIAEDPKAWAAKILRRKAG